MYIEKSLEFPTRTSWRSFKNSQSIRAVLPFHEWPNDSRTWEDLNWFTINSSTSSMVSLPLAAVNWNTVTLKWSEVQSIESLIWLGHLPCGALIHHGNQSPNMVKVHIKAGEICLSKYKKILPLTDCYLHIIINAWKFKLMKMKIHKTKCLVHWVRILWIPRNYI